MQHLLTLILLALVGSLSAQDVIWTEDFSKGFTGWSTNPLICGANSGATYGNISGPEFGVWQLTSGTVDGLSLILDPEEVFEWTFLNETEYMFIQYVQDYSRYGTVYGTYRIDESNVLTSSVEEASVIADGLAFGETTAGGTVEWASNILTANLPFYIRFIGVGNPTIEFMNGGNELIYTADNGNVELIYTKRSECGTLWTWSPNGNLGTGALAIDAPGEVFVDSDSRTNGTMVMRNIFHMFGGDPSNVPSSDPPPFPFYAAELISPPIDISATERALSLSLSQMIGYLNTPVEAPDSLRSSFQVSTDNGLTWSSAVDINPGLPSSTFRSNRQTVPIPFSLTNGADEIRVKFTFATDYYFWGIDDISIQERTTYDLQANENFFAVADNVNTPWVQLQPQYFGANIQNNGGLTAENVQLNLTIKKEDTGEEVYNATKNYGDLPPDSLASNDFFTDILDLSPSPNTIGTYTGQYIVSHDSVDMITDNDTLSFAFAVTDSTFAKETGRTHGIVLPDEARAWYIGNSYYVPNGEDYYARWISFMVENASEVVALDALSIVTILLYESDGDVDGDGRVGPNEYNNVPIAFNEYIFDGTEDQQLITIPLYVDEVGVEMADGKYYFIVLQYAGVSADDLLVLSASDKVNYAANNFITDAVGIAQYATVVDLVLEQPNFFTGGFGDASVPIIRLQIGDHPDLYGPPVLPGASTLLPDNYEVDIFPTPARDNFKLDLDFPDAQDVLIRFYDQMGRIHIQQEFDGVQKARYHYSVSTLPAGVYYIQLNTDVGTRSEKVVIQR